MQATPPATESNTPLNLLQPAFYYNRPTSVFAAHGYGRILLAGPGMIRLPKTHRFEINDSAVQFYRKGT